MKPLTLFLAGVVTLASCAKVNPIFHGCDVAEYHNSFYDAALSPDIPFLFRKTYDGNTVREIDFSFWDVYLPRDVRFHYLTLSYKGRYLYMLDKADPEDTAVVVTFNAGGRVASVSYKGEINDSGTGGLNAVERFSYRDNRVVAVQRVAGEFTNLDSVFYDRFGNVISAVGNPYTYDYSKRATQQFYCDDLMEVYDGFYLMQYLGLFPEVTSPVNVRTYAHDTELGADLSNWTFDREGKLTGYAKSNSMKISITWHCQ
jgi:hypothetical protein